MTSEQLQELLQKEQAGACTPEEQAMLLQWYEQLDVSGSLYMEDEPVEAVAGLSETMLQQFRQRLEARRAPVRKMRVWYAVAAAVLLFVVGGWWFEVGRRGADKQPIVQKPTVHDVLPGGDKAILQLADGSEMMLDTVADGLVTEQEHIKVIKLKDGELSYSRESGVRSQEPKDSRESIVDSREPVKYNVLRTPKGGQYRLVLPDGTKVWLNAASSIRFPTTFSEKERRVTITGEVYFEVAKASSPKYKGGREGALPFIVDVDGRSTVEVLGTHFNINAYNDEPDIKTTLLEGSVRLTRNAERITLKPGEQAVAGTYSPFTIDHSPGIDEVIAWKEGYFKYHEADIRTILRQAARWYDVEVVFEGNITTEKFRGTIGRNVKLSEFLQILELNNIHFDIQGKKIIVKK